MDVGFIGLGQMGAGMAANLVKARHRVTVFNRTAERTRPLVDAGAAAAVKVADTCRGEVVITMVADDDALAAMMFGDDGILAALAPGALHVSASTISVAFSERLTAEHAARGQRFVSAPVFGRPEAAAAGKLFIVAAGPDAAVAAARPLLEVMGQRTFVVSQTPNAANLVKLSGNFLIACVLESLGEAMALVSKGGIDRHEYLELLTSTLFTAPLYSTYGALIADRRFEPAGFTVPLGQKDIRLALAAAEELQVPLPLASLLRDRFLTVRAHGGDHLDWSAIGAVAARDAGAT